MSTGCGNNGGTIAGGNDAASTGCGHKAGELRRLLERPCDGLLRVRCPAELIAAAIRRADSAGGSLAEYARRAVAAALIADAIRERAAAARAVPVTDLFMGD